MVKTVSQSEYARQRSVTPGYINKLVKQGVLKLQEGKINPEQADQDIQAYASGLKGTPGPKATGQPDDDSLASWRKRELQVKTAIRQIQLDEGKGKLVNIDELRAEFGKLFVDIKTRIRAIGPKVAQEVSFIKLNSQNEKAATVAVQKIIMAECDEALKELSQWGTQKKNPKGGKKNEESNRIKISKRPGNTGTAV